MEGLLNFSSLISKATNPDLIGRARRKLLRRSGRTFGAEYLDSYGWQASQQQQMPIDGLGDPIPWYTYPAIHVLRSVASRNYRVFEYGCGNSSLWWASNAASVVSIEHNPQWAELVKAKAPANLTVHVKPQTDHTPQSSLIDTFVSKYPDLPSSGFRDLDIEHGLTSDGFTDYANTISNYEPFDIVVVDGMARCLTAWMAAHHLTENGFIVFDNADRWQYNPGYQALSDLGFGRVDFWGPGPMAATSWCTSIFFRNPKWSQPLIQLDPSKKSALDWVISGHLAVDSQA